MSDGKHAARRLRHLCRFLQPGEVAPWKRWRPMTGIFRSVMLRIS